MMKPIGAAFALLLACAGAQATNQIEVHGRSLHALTSAEASELQGRYALGDGRVLEVLRTVRRLSAVFDGREYPLLAVSATRLQSVGGELTLEFDSAANGSVRGVKLTRSTAPAADPAKPALAALAAPAPAPSR